MRALALLVFAVGACHLSSEASRGSLRGSVLVSGQSALGNLVVSAIGPTVTTTATQSDGRFVISELPAGHYRIVALVPSTREQQLAAEIDVDGESELAPLTFTAIGRISGRVMQAGAPVAGALIGATGETTETTTDADGRFMLDPIAVGTASIYVLHRGAEPALRDKIAVTWGQASMVPDIALVDDPVVLTRLTLEVSRVGTTARDGVVARLEGTSVSGTSDTSGTITLEPIEPGLYALELTHPGGVLRIPRVYFGNGSAFVVDSGITPLGPVRLSAGRRVASGRFSPALFPSPSSTYVLMDGGIYEVAPTPILRFTLASLGLVEPAFVGFLPDEVTLVVSARSVTDSRRRSLYRISASTGTTTFLRDFDDSNVHLMPATRSALLADRVDGTSKSEMALFQSIDDPATSWPIGDVLAAGMISPRRSVHGTHLLLPTSGETRMVRVADGVTIGRVGNLAPQAWHPDYELVAFVRDGNRTLDASGVETNFGDALPSGPGWSLGPGWTFGPTTGLRTADRTSAYGRSVNTLVHWDVATGAATTLDGSCPAAEPLVLYAGEKRLAYSCAHDGATELRLLDLEANSKSDCGLFNYAFGVGEAGDRFLFVDGADRLRSVAADGSDPRTLFEHSARFVVDPSGQWVAATRVGQEVWLVRIADGNARQLADDGLSPGFLSSTVLSYVRSSSAPSYGRGLYFVEVSL